MDLTVQRTKHLEAAGKSSVVTLMLFGLLLIAWIGEWPLSIDTVMYNGHWRSAFVVFAPLFTPVPGIDLFPWQLMLVALVPLCIGAAGTARMHAPELDRALVVSAASIAVVFLWGMIRGGSAYYAYYQVWRFLAALLIAYMLMSALRSPRDLVTLGRIVVLTGLIRATLCIYVYWTQVHDKVFPLPEFVTNHDDSLLFVAAILTSLIWALLKGGRSTWLMTLLVVAYVSYAVVLNTRRIAWAELVMALILIYLTLGPGPVRTRINRWGRWIAPVVVLYFIAGMGSDSPVFAPVHALTTMGSNYDPSSLTRQEEDRNLLRTLVDSGNPLFGLGWGRPYDKVESVWSNYSSSWVLVLYTPHNALLGLAAFSGLVGMLGIWGVVPLGGFLAARGYRGSTELIPRAAALISLGSLAAYSAHCYGDIGLQSFQGCVMFGVALATAGKVAAWSVALPQAQTGVTGAGQGPPAAGRKSRFRQVEATRGRFGPPGRSRTSSRRLSR